MTPLDLGHDDGYLDVTIGNDTVKVDLFLVGNRVLELQQRDRDKPMAEQHQAIVDLMKELRLPAVSHRVADRFACGILDKLADVGALAKKKEPSSDSPSPTPEAAASTASASSTAAPASNSP
jgi:hypothetical protein